MKRFIYCLALCFSAVSCVMAETDASHGGTGMGELVLTIRPGAPDSKDTDVPAYEQAVTDVQILAFDSQGGLGLYLNAEAGIRDVSLTLIEGEYDVWAVVNGPDCSETGSLEELTAKEVLLGDWNSTDPDKGLVMVGNSRVVVAAGRRTDAPVTVERLVSRVRVGSIMNDLPEEFGDIVVKGICLANVVGNQSIGGNASPEVWYNCYGSPTGVQGEYVDGSDVIAECADMTWREIGATIGHGETVDVEANLYSYRNEVREFPFFPSPFTGSGPVLFLYVCIAGEWYHLDKELPFCMYENTAAEVNLVITGIVFPGEKETGVELANGIVMIWQNMSGGSAEI